MMELKKRLKFEKEKTQAIENIISLIEDIEIIQGCLYGSPKHTRSVYIKAQGDSEYQFSTDLINLKKTMSHNILSLIQEAIDKWLEEEKSNLKELIDSTKGGLANEI